MVPSAIFLLNVLARLNFVLLSYVFHKSRPIIIGTSNSAPDGYLSILSNKTFHLLSKLSSVGKSNHVHISKHLFLFFLLFGVPIYILHQIIQLQDFCSFLKSPHISNYRYDSRRNISIHSICQFFVLINNRPSHT